MPPATLVRSGRVGSFAWSLANASQCFSPAPVRLLPKIASVRATLTHLSRIAHCGGAAFPTGVARGPAIVMGVQTGTAVQATLAFRSTRFIAVSRRNRREHFDVR